MNLEEFEIIARQTREDFEQQRIDYEGLKPVYQSHARIDDLDEFVERSKRIFPDLNCGLASAELQRRLGRGKLLTGQFYDDIHTVLLLEEENIIVDITADQFFGPKIYVGPIKWPWYFG